MHAVLQERRAEMGLAGAAVVMVEDGPHPGAAVAGWIFPRLLPAGHRRDIGHLTSTFARVINPG